MSLCIHWNSFRSRFVLFFEQNLRLVEKIVSITNKYSSLFENLPFVVPFSDQHLISVGDLSNRRLKLSALFIIHLTHNLLKGKLQSLASLSDESTLHMVHLN